MRDREEGAISSSAVWRRAVAASLAGTLLVAAAALLVYWQDLRHREALLMREGDYVVALEQEFLSQELRAVHSDLLFLAQQPLLERMLVGAAGARAALEREYAGFARTKPLYDQIRILDETGREAVRVNRRGEEVQIVDESDLQLKGNRGYFRAGIELGVGEVFVSPLDLNVEHGEIERPLNPVIRLVTPVADPLSGRRALLVLNYAAARLLGKLREVAAASRGEMMLVDPQGEYLQSPDPGREWGWLLGHEDSFRSDHPAVWERILADDRIQTRIDGDLFTATWVPLVTGAAEENRGVAIISRIPLSEGHGVFRGTGTALLLLGTFVAIVAAAFYWARSTLARRAQEQHIAASEGRLRALSSRLLAAQEDERRSLSRMLHDDLGQRVTTIALDLKATLPHADEAGEKMLRRAVGEAEQVLSSLHEIATRVRPSVLDDLGLEHAIESYVSDYEERTGVSVDLELRLPPEGPSGAAAENVYRILQEALSNVSIHAGTAAARVELVAEPGALALTIEDEGRGFDAMAVKSLGRLGILGMRERVELLGGEFELETAPGRGTRIHVRLPLPPSFRGVS